MLAWSEPHNRAIRHIQLRELEKLIGPSSLSIGSPYQPLESRSVPFWTVSLFRPELKLRTIKKSFRRVHQLKPFVCRRSLAMWTNNPFATSRDFWPMRPKRVVGKGARTWVNLAVAEYLRASGTVQRPLRHLRFTQNAAATRFSTLPQPN